jgi:hypothetical protein
MSFNIIRSKGDADKVTLVDDTVIHRDPSGKIFVPEYGAFVRCAPYGNHFIFEVPVRIKGPAWMCSCGSPAHMVGAKAYGHLSSYKDAMIVCQNHTTFNRHADGSS